MNQTCNLQSKQCIPCEGGVPALTKDEVETWLAQLPGWTVDPKNPILRRRFTFKSFYKTMAFVNAVAFIANQENHHPDMELGYNYCVVRYTTHAIAGLSLNDFICAAKVNTLGTL